ncbi:hypothetical protein pb186bvf_005523 [Paramecium bursaria]
MYFAIFLYQVTVNTQVITLEENIVCKFTSCNAGGYLQNKYNYGIESFGDISTGKFTFQVLVRLSSTSTNNFVMSLMDGPNIRVQILQTAQQEFDIDVGGTFSYFYGSYISNNWYQIFITQSQIFIADYMTQYSMLHHLVLTQTTRFNLFSQSSSQYWIGQACCILFYKGVDVGYFKLGYNDYLQSNVKYPEAIINLNIQEKIQSNITTDYSDYQYISKLGDQFNFDTADPIISDGYIFNGSQYIQMNDVNLSKTYSFEFRMALKPLILSSNIVLLNYTFSESNVQIFIFINGSSIAYKIGTTVNSFLYISQTYLHFFIGVFQSFEETVNKYSICFFQFNDTHLIANYTDAKYYNAAQFFNGAGSIRIGSQLNQFATGESFELFHFRYYQGLFLDDTKAIDPLCQIYLGDRCIICITGYILSLDHKCVTTCNSTLISQNLSTSHNQCIRTCHTICATCSSPQICLTCNGIRVNPPLCTCPLGYFDDGVSPNCRQYYPDYTVKTGQAIVNCAFTGFIGTTISYGITYVALPKVAIFLQGVTQNSLSTEINMYVNTFSTTSFQLMTSCLFVGQIYIINWISGVGYNIINAKEGSASNAIAISLPLISNMDATPSLAYSSIPSIMGWNFVFANNYSLLISSIQQTSFSINSPNSVKFVKYNYVQTDFINFSYNNSIVNNSIMQIPLPNIPKSIRFINIFQGMVTTVSTGSFQLYTSKINSTYLQFYSGQNITNLQGTILFTAQKCNNNTGPCDFYQTLISSCNTQFSVCQCNEVNYFINSTFYCDKCDSNCYTCSGLSTSCTSCIASQNKTLSVNQCICLSTQYLEVTNNTCMNCDITCLTCNGATNQSCLQCKANANILNGVCNCDSGYYFDAIQALCVICHANCQTCTGSLINNCLSCYLPKVYNLTNQTCDCPNGQYLTATLSCQSCDLTCLTCTGIANTQCSACDISRQLTISGIDQTFGYYLSSNGSCLICGFSCLTCLTTSTNCLSCPLTRTISSPSTCICQTGYYESGQQSCSQCLQCPTCLSANQCLSCSDPYQTLILGQCICQTGYYVDSMSLNCQICQLPCINCLSDTICTSCTTDKILQGEKCVCDIQNYLDSNGICQKCQPPCIQCSGPDNNQCITCPSDRYLNNLSECSCNQGLYEDSQFTCQKCDSSCINCNSALECIDCPFTRQIDQTTQLCGCSQGFYEIADQILCGTCLQNCYTCQNNLECLSCIDNQILLNGQCICADGFYSDGNLNCISCDSKQGLYQIECNKGNCSDGFWTPGEKCDDGNTVDRDGCTQCLIDTNYQCINNLNQPSVCYKCQDNCKLCSYQFGAVKCKQCQDGYYLSQNQCIQCSSNCLACQSKSFCTSCPITDTKVNDDGTCPKCDENMFVQNGKCVSICGDGLLAEGEFCDFGASNGQGGCTLDCQEQTGFTCVNNVCSKIPVPDIEVQYVNSTTKTQFQIQIAEIQPTQQYCSLLKVKIDGFEQAEFNSSFILSDGNCNIVMDYKKTIKESNLIRIHIPLNTTISLRNLQGDYREVVITPRQQIYYSQDQIQQAQNVQSAQDSFTILMYFLGPIAALLGGFDFFLTMLDILSWINNLYYINIQFPLNVQMIFQNSVWSSLQIFPSSTLPQFNQPDDPYYRESPPHFMEKGTDPLFLNNTLQTYGLWALYILAYLMALWIVKILRIKFSVFGQKEKNRTTIFKIGPEFQEKEAFSVEEVQSSHKLQLPKIFINLYKKCNQYVLNVKSYLLKLLNLSYLDCVSAITLQLNCFDMSQTKYSIVLANFVLTYVTIAICLYILYLSYFVSQQHIMLLKHKSFLKRYGTLYEGINLNNENAIQYAFLNLLRKTLYLIAVVCFYESPIFQTASCCFISFINVGFIIYENPFESRDGLIQIGVPDFCIFGLMFIFTVISIDDKVNYFTDLQRYNIGWAIIALIIISIGTQIYFMFRQFFIDLKERILYVYNKIKSFTQK